MFFATFCLLFVGVFLGFGYSFALKEYPELASYQFKYLLNKDGLQLQQHEHRRGKLTRGSYSVLQSDGNIRDVHYEVDRDRGYNSIVDYRPFTGKFMGHLIYPRDFKHPVKGIEPVAFIPRELLTHSKHHKKH